MGEIQLKRGVQWTDIAADTESVVAQYFGEVPQGTQYVVGMSFVGPSGLAQVKQDLMHRITFHDAGHMKHQGHVPYYTYTYTYININIWIYIFIYIYGYTYLYEYVDMVGTSPTPRSAVTRHQRVRDTVWSG